MYVGRMAFIGKTPKGANIGLYRLSSRNYTKRVPKLSGDTMSIVQEENTQTESLGNPYVQYNCVRIAGDYAVLGNGTHTDSISEKISGGFPIRDAIGLTLFAFDYERDEYSTPRIAGVVGRQGDVGWLGIVRKDGLIVKEIPLRCGRVAFVATYEKDDISETQAVALEENDVASPAKAVVHAPGFRDFSNVVLGVSVVAQSHNFALDSHIA